MIPVPRRSCPCPGRCRPQARPALHARRRRPHAPAQAQTGPAAADVDNAAVTETIQVTATRVPEDVEPVPASVTVITGDELAGAGVTDLPSALALVAGVASPRAGTTARPASVPEIWGLREFDAFLLVVDGVPWGGAFNPALPPSTSTTSSGSRCCAARRR